MSRKIHAAAVLVHTGTAVKDACSSVLLLNLEIGLLGVTLPCFIFFLRTGVFLLPLCPVCLHRKPAAGL